MGRHLGTEPADCPLSTPGFHVFIFLHSRQSLLPHRHMGAKPGKSHSENRSTYLFNSVCQVISTKTRKRYFIPFLSIKSLKSVVHFVYPMHFCLDILPLKVLKSCTARGYSAVLGSAGLDHVQKRFPQILILCVLEAIVNQAKSRKSMYSSVGRGLLSPAF